MSFSLRSALLVAALFSAQAAAVEFTFVSGNPAPEAFGNSYAQTLDGLTTTVTAWSTTGRRGSYQTAELEIYSGYGMGVCSRSEGINCSSSGNMHALDNKGADDLILFRFSSAVQLDSLTLRQFGGDAARFDASILPDDMFRAQAERRVALGLLLGEVIRRESLKADPARVRGVVEEMAREREKAELSVGL